MSASVDQNSGWDAVNLLTAYTSMYPATGASRHGRPARQGPVERRCEHEPQNTTTLSSPMSALAPRRKGRTERGSCGQQLLPTQSDAILGRLSRTKDGKDIIQAAPNCLELYYATGNARRTRAKLSLQVQDHQQERQVVVPASRPTSVTYPAAADEDENTEGEPCGCRSRPRGSYVVCIRK